MNYDPLLSILQLVGNHAERLSIKQLEDCNYPTTKVLIRCIKPAAAMDDSYVDELHIYLVQKDSKIAYDLFFDSSQVDKKLAEEIAKTFIISSDYKSEQRKIPFYYENIKDYFYERVNYDPDEDLLSFTIPKTIPENYKFYLHISGRCIHGTQFR
jgi:hypothetical protein